MDDNTSARHQFAVAAPLLLFEILIRSGTCGWVLAARASIGSVVALALLGNQHGHAQTSPINIGGGASNAQVRLLYENFSTTNPIQVDAPHMLPPEQQPGIIKELILSGHEWRDGDYDGFVGTPGVDTLAPLSWKAGEKPSISSLAFVFSQFRAPVPVWEADGTLSVQLFGYAPKDTSGSTVLQWQATINVPTDTPAGIQLTFAPGSANDAFEKQLMGFGHNCNDLWPITWILICISENAETHETVILLNEVIQTLHPTYITAEVSPEIGDQTFNSLHLWSLYEIACGSTHGETLPTDDNAKYQALNQTANRLWAGAFSSSFFAPGGLESVKYDHLCREVGKPLAYYYPQVAQGQLPPHVSESSADMFHDTDGDGTLRGDCTCWANLFARCMDVLALQHYYQDFLVGVNAVILHCPTPTGYESDSMYQGVPSSRILPRDVNLQGVGQDYTGPPQPWLMFFPWSMATALGHLTHVAAHGVPQPAPMNFDNHCIVRVTTQNAQIQDPPELKKFFCPSYGQSTRAFWEMENSLFGGRTAKLSGAGYYKNKADATPSNALYMALLVTDQIRL